MEDIIKRMEELRRALNKQEGHCLAAGYDEYAKEAARQGTLLNDLLVAFRGNPRELDARIALANQTTQGMQDLLAARDAEDEENSK